MPCRRVAGSGLRPKRTADFAGKRTVSCSRTPQRRISSPSGRDSKSSSIAARRRPSILAELCQRFSAMWRSCERKLAGVCLFNVLWWLGTVVRARIMTPAARAAGGHAARAHRRCTALRGAPIVPVARDQLFVRAALDESPASITNTRSARSSTARPMRNDDRRASSDRLIDRLQYFVFCRAVDRRRRVIEQQDARFEGARRGQWANRWRWPPDRLHPSSAMTVS